MEIILLERVAHLGQMGDKVNVRPGYARNFLFPRKKALRATSTNIAFFEAQKAQLEADNASRKAEAEKIAEKLNGLKVVLVRSAGESGHLYGSVSARDIAVAVNEAGFDGVTKGMVLMGHPIKTIGLFDQVIHLHPEVEISIRLNVARSEEEAKLQEERGAAIVAAEAKLEAEASAVVDVAADEPAEAVSYDEAKAEAKKARKTKKSKAASEEEAAEGEEA